MSKEDDENKEFRLAPFKNEYNEDGDRLCEGCLEPLGDVSMRWCEDCEAIYNIGFNEAKEGMNKVHKGQQNNKKA